MPRFAATTLGWTGGWVRQLPHVRGQSPEAGGQDKGKRCPQKAPGTWSLES